MRRLHLIFAIVVVTAFLSAYVAERSRSREQPTGDFETPRRVTLDALDPHRGTPALRGSVVGHDGQPAPGVTVHLRLLRSEETVIEPMFFDHSSDDGVFEVRHLPAGTFEVVLLSTGVPNQKFELRIPAGEQRFVLGEPWGDLAALPQIERDTLTGRLKFPSDLLLGDRSLEGYEVVLLPRDTESTWAGAFARRVPTDADGGFALDGLAVADYTLHVLPPWARGGSWPYLCAIDYDHRVAGDRDPQEVLLEVGALHGRLRDVYGRGIQGALLQVHAKDGERDLWPAVSTDEQGRFRVHDLPPDVYVVRAFAGGERRELEMEVAEDEDREVSFGPIDPRALD